jgi:hypothetical protein
VSQDMLVVDYQLARKVNKKLQFFLSLGES